MAIQQISDVHDLIELARAVQENWLFRDLPTQQALALARDLELVSLTHGDVVIKAQQQLTHVFFPTTALLSGIMSESDGRGIEVGAVGRDGFAGMPAHIGIYKASFNYVVQVPGHALKMTVEDFARHLGNDDWRPLVMAYATKAFIVACRSALCVAYHPAEERLARWLLFVRSVLEQDDLPLTQEFLAVMLAVQRPTVSIAAGILQAAGLITYKYGKIKVINVEGLKAASCECGDAIV